MISSTALRYFAEVARAGSIRAASERLHVAASAISRQLALLEDALGAPMVDRGRGRTKLRLTPAGELLLRHIRQTETELERVRSQIEALKGLRTGHIRLGVPETLVRHMLPSLLLRFRKKYPGVTYSVQVHGSPRLVGMVSQDELDVAVTYNPPAALHVKHVYEKLLPTCVLVSSQHPLADRASVKISDCADYGLALPDETISAKGDYDEMFAKARMRPRAALVTNSYELLKSVAIAGVAITLANPPPGEPHSGHGYRYVPISDARVKPQRLTVCTFEQRNPSPITAMFIEYLTKDFEKLEQE
jgi:DNA-binding transcriptional LysR family regulator